MGAMKRKKDSKGHFTASTNDLTGQRFGRWLVIRRSEIGNRQVYWHCVCDCGVEKAVAANNLPNGASRSCGCINKEEASARFTKHGLTRTQEYTLWNSAKVRAKKANIPFDLSPADVVIPDVCPLLGTPILRNNSLTPNSPSIDRIDPKAGYVKGNTWVISFRANVIKNNASPAELRQIADKLEERLGKN